MSTMLMVSLRERFGLPGEREGMLIGGAWIAAVTAPSFVEVVDPRTEQAIGRVVTGGIADIDAAVWEAASALSSWSTTPLAARRKILVAFDVALDLCRDELAELLALEVGTSEERGAHQIRQASASLRALVLESAVALPARIESGDLVYQRPLGVVGIITPSEQSVGGIVASVGAALLAGSTVVLKPSTLAPCNAMYLANLFARAGLPSGVLNVVTGHGSRVGEALCGHPFVDALAFSGSREIASRLSTHAAACGKRYSVRSGIDHTALVLDEVRLSAAVSQTVKRCLAAWSDGESSSARLVLPTESMQRAEELVREAVAEFDGSTALPPRLTRGQQFATLELIESALNHGARTVLGADQPSMPDAGYYLPLVVLSNIHPTMDIARHELEGPVLLLMGHEGFADGVDIANGAPEGECDVWANEDADALATVAFLRSTRIRLNGGSDEFFAGHGHREALAELQRFTNQVRVHASQLLSTIELEDVKPEHPAEQYTPNRSEI